jgi:hypothetical protein
MLAAMIWWDWSRKQQWAFLGGLFALACVPGLLLSLSTDMSNIAPDWQLELASGMFLLLFLLPAWYLFV